MARVLVTHRWMGDLFREALAEAPTELRMLARSVTAIVLTADTPQAFIDPSSGAIYIGGPFLWRTPEQRLVVTTERDFRTDFGLTIPFTIPFRLVDGDEDVFAALRSEDSRARVAGTVLTWILYHELTHAVDLAPPHRWESPNPEATPIDVTFEDFTHWLSYRLVTENPLRSELLSSLGEVFFLGREATEEEERLSPELAAQEFAADGAVDFYSYSNLLEYFADTHDTFLMSHLHGLENDVAVVRRDDGTVVWGQRGRIADPNVIGAVRQVIDLAYPGDAQAAHGHLEALPAPRALQAGATWADSIALPAGQQPSSWPKLVACIRVPENAPAAILERLGGGILGERTVGGRDVGGVRPGDVHRANGG